MIKLLCPIGISIFTIVVGTLLYILPDLIEAWRDVRQHRETLKEIRQLRQISKDIEYICTEYVKEAKRD